MCENWRYFSPYRSDESQSVNLKPKLQNPFLKKKKIVGESREVSRLEWFKLTSHDSAFTELGEFMRHQYFHFSHRDHQDGPPIRQSAAQCGDAPSAADYKRK